MHLHIARGRQGAAKLGFDGVMQILEPMERHTRKRVMRGMVRHVPQRPAHEARHQKGARVLGRVEAGVQADMLADVLKLMERLGRDHGQKPQRHRQPRIEGDRQRSDDRIADPMPAHLDDHIAALRGSQPIRPGRDRAPRDVEQHLHAEDPVAETGKIKEEIAERVFQPHQKLGVLFPIPSVAVMGEMDPAFPHAGIKKNESRAMGHDVVDPARLERGQVVAFMLGREQRVDEIAVQQEQRHRPPSAPGRPQRTARGAERAHMARELKRAAQIRTA